MVPKFKIYFIKCKSKNVTIPTTSSIVKFLVIIHSLILFYIKNN